MDEHDEEAGRRKVSELIGGIDYALFTTQGTGGDPLHARPMALRKAEDNGDLWFFSKKDSRKAKELTADPQVLVTFADPKKQHFVTVAGRAEIVAERPKVEAMWSESLPGLVSRRSQGRQRRADPGLGRTSRVLGHADERDGLRVRVPQGRHDRRTVARGRGRQGRSDVSGKSQTFATQSLRSPEVQIEPRVEASDG